jgi:threonine synthase
LGEGWTPLVKFSDSLFFKLESLNPTGSFKDRGSTVLVSTLQQRLKASRGFISEDSSGNAGASMAAYAARSNLKAKIYVPESVAGPKFAQIQHYGAEVAKIAGGRDKVMEEAQKPEEGKFYVGHLLHPLFRDGIRSLAYEMAEQFNWNLPERVYLPVSAGTLLLGVLAGFTHLHESNVMSSIPTVVACQSRQVSPVYSQIKGVPYDPPEKVTSIADALASTKPPLSKAMVDELRRTEGDAVVVEEDETLQAFKELARKGFFVEPSSALAYAAYLKQLEKGELPSGMRVIIVLTGNGLKTTLRPD